MCQNEHFIQAIFGKLFFISSFAGRWIVCQRQNKVITEKGGKEVESESALIVGAQT